MKIILCGLNGAGKSTVGKALAQRLGFPFRDIEDYYFPDGGGDYKYHSSRTREEVSALLLRDLRKARGVELLPLVSNPFWRFLPRLACRAPARLLSSEQKTLKNCSLTSAKQFLRSSFSSRLGESRRE